MIDLLLVTLGVALGASAALLAPTPLMVVAVSASVLFLLAALVFRRTGLLIACGALIAACALSAYLASPGTRLWLALAHGIGLLVLLDVGWDRVRLVSALLGARTYAARLSAIARVAAVSVASVFVAATLGYGTVLELGVDLPFVVVVCAAALAGGAGAALVLGALKRRGRETGT